MNLPPDATLYAHIGRIYLANNQSEEACLLLTSDIQARSSCGSDSTHCSNILRKTSFREWMTFSTSRSK